MTLQIRLLCFLCAFSSLAVSAVGCTSKEGASPSAATSQESVATLSPEVSAAVAQQLRAESAAGRLADLRWPDFTDYLAHVQKFYDSTGYQPAWVQGTKPTPQALEMIKALEASEGQGLNPEDYDASRWASRMATMSSAGGNEGSAAIARFDLAMTVCTMRYISDLHIGRVNPQHFDFGIDVASKKYDLPQLLSEKLVKGTDIPATIDAVEPPLMAYKRTKDALRRYLDLQHQVSVQPLPAVDKPVKVGDNYAGAPQLATLLNQLGDLPATTPPGDNTTTFSQPLSDAVRKFQNRHGLTLNGQLNKETLAELNIPISVRVQQLQDALERYRWLSPQFALPPIVVNIPEFRLRAFSADRTVALRMNVVVGKAFRHQTPVFTDQMKYVVFRPYWNVPPSIQRSEIVPAIQKDRMYLAKKGFEVTNSKGDVIPSTPVSDDLLQKLRSGALMVRQKPGDKNALGLAKFIFPNTHNVYLHGTPAQSLFAVSRRDFSHGCIRTENPAALAAWVLRGDPQWTPERIKAAMISGPDNQQVNLKTPIPVLILYITAVVEENGDIWFFHDIYGFDRSLEAVLAKGYPYPG
jgi:L,D-transpeptidase YcbB